MELTRPEVTDVRPTGATPTGAPTPAAAAEVAAPRLEAPELVDVVVDLWRSVTAQEAAPAPAAVGPWPGARTPVLRASVGVEGATEAAWSGDVVVTCPVGAAHRWARHLLGLDDDEQPADDDVLDVLGEVANVVAGAVKARCAPGGLMGLPRVGDAPSPLGPRERPGVVVSTVLRWAGVDDDHVTVVALVSRAEASPPRPRRAR